MRASRGMSSRSSSIGMRGAAWAVVAAVALALAMPASAQLQNTAQESFALKIFKVESALYPFVQVYFRTFDQNQEPLINLNEMNMGIMVKGRAYDPAKRQYRVMSIANRQEAVRTVLVIDCSRSMAGVPFEAALRAAARFIDSKRPQDQVAVLAIRDTKDGYEQVSAFERDPSALGRRIGDIANKCDGNRTRLYDSIAAALQMCGMVSQGGTSSGDAEYIISNSIVVFSDGKDEGSALSREELNGRITQLGIPVPVYSLGYTRVEPKYLANLQAISKNSFGKYYSIGEAYNTMQRCVEDIQNILQNDYVLVFRSYIPVDGNKYALKMGLEYPSRSGKMVYQSSEFEAIEPPPVQQLLQQQQKLAQLIPALPDSNPYMTTPGITPQPAEAAPAAPAAGAAAAALEKGATKPATK